ncbi:MAG: efflux RND transporter periplasmic adaptor subunit [Desulfobulbaceae bacterium]|nr:efflux RND transporter periplasmic adaptor subunit [Desulfobulbaceae bacterium]
MASHDRPELQNKHAKTGQKVKILLQILFSLIVLGCSFTIANYYLDTSPKAKPKKRAPRPPLVQVQEVNFTSQIYTIQATGTVVGAKEVELSSRVSGEITALSSEMVPGGYFTTGDSLLSIDQADYKLNILQLQSEVAKARNDLELEMGNQRIAQKEFEILAQEVSVTEKKLMLRMPQLGIAKANLAGIEAKLKQAELELSRTDITAPFNGVVLSRSVEVGSRVSQATVLAKLVGTDEFWVKLTIPLDQLQWLNIPIHSSQTGSKVRIYLQNKTAAKLFRKGTVIRLGAGLEQDGRMAVVYVRVKDPLSLQAQNKNEPRLLLDSFVTAEIDGRIFTDIAVIPRDLLRENNSVWLLSDDNTLEIRKVKIAARSRGQIFIESGLVSGERLISSTVANPVEGISLKIMEPSKPGPRKRGGEDR